MIGSLSQTELTEVSALCPRLYEAVGWSPDRVPDWDAFRDCCHAQATLVPMGSGAANPIPLEAFIEGMEAQRTSGALVQLAERELANSVEGFGNLATVRSTFVAEIDGVERRGVTYAIIVREGAAWKIISTAWENESEGRPLPQQYL